jgi:hypothetical protein
VPLFSRSRPVVPPVPPLDPGVLAGLETKRGEKPLAHAWDAEGRTFVATRLALYVPLGSTGRHRRVPWHLVQAAEWDRDTGVLTLLEWADPGEQRVVTRAAFTAADLLLTVLRERVTATVVLTRTAPVDGTDVFVTASIRRRADDGELFVQASYPVGFDHTLPEVVAAADEAIAQARDDVGL